MIENNIAVYCETKEDAYLFLEWLVKNTNIQWSSGRYVNPTIECYERVGYFIIGNKLYVTEPQENYIRFIEYYGDEYPIFKTSDIISKFYNMPSKESLMDFLIGEENV